MPWQQDVLHSMGLAVLQPRFDFPAAVPGLLQWDEHSDIPLETPAATIVVEQTPQQQHTAAAIPASLDVPVPEKLSNTRILDVVANTSANKVVEVAATNDANAPLRFRQRLLRFDHLMVLVDQPSLQWADEEPAMAFIADIYFALYGRAPAQFQQAVFNWPPVKNFPLANNRDEARLTLLSFMREMLAGIEQAAVLSFGRGAEYLTKEPPGLGDCQPLDNLRVLALHPIQHYWQQPSSKHLLWQHLQAIKKIGA